MILYLSLLPLLLSITINIVFTLTLYKIYKEKKNRFNYEKDQAWIEVLEVLNKNKEILVNGNKYTLDDKNNFTRNTYSSSSLVQLENDFLKENESKIRKYSLEKELKRHNING